MTDQHRTSVLFLCLGNICRSPLAEGIFLHRARERGAADRFLVDSAGTGGWHVGKRADPRSIAVAERYGVDLPSRARTLVSDDGSMFDLVIAMDQRNAQDAVEMGIPESRVRLMRSYDPQSEPGAEVPDPYHGGNEGFDRVYEMLVRACDGLLDELLGSAEGR